MRISQWSWLLFPSAAQSTSVFPNPNHGGPRRVWPQMWSDWGSLRKGQRNVGLIWFNRPYNAVILRNFWYTAVQHYSLSNCLISGGLDTNYSVHLWNSRRNAEDIFATLQLTFHPLTHTHTALCAYGGPVCGTASSSRRGEAQSAPTAGISLRRRSALREQMMRSMGGVLWGAQAYHSFPDRDARNMFAGLDVQCPLHRSWKWPFKLHLLT